MSIGRYCRRDVATVDREETIQNAAALMEERGVGCLVVTAGGKPWGMLTDRDIALRTIRGELDARHATLAAIAELSLVTIREDRPVRVATLLMERFGIRRLPVCDAKHQIVGIVAWDDLFVLVAHELEAIAGTVAAQTPRLPIPATRALAEIHPHGDAQ